MKNIKKQRKIAIIGAGASGLSLAFELQKLGFHIDIFEKNVAGEWTLKHERK